MSSTLFTVLHAAFCYRKEGLTVLPAQFGSKDLDYRSLGLPFVEESLKNYQQIAVIFPWLNKSPTEEELHRWFGGGTQNIALVTGPDLIVLDFDNVRAFDAWLPNQSAAMKATPIQRTPNGYHVLLRPRRMMKTSVLYWKGQKVGHLKGVCSYIIVAPSQHPSGLNYCWLPGHAPWETRLAEIETVEELGFTKRPWYRKLFKKPERFSYPKI